MKRDFVASDERASTDCTNLVDELEVWSQLAIASKSGDEEARAFLATYEAWVRDVLRGVVHH